MKTRSEAAGEDDSAQPRPQTRTADAAGQGRTPLYYKNTGGKNARKRICEIHDRGCCEG